MAFGREVPDAEIHLLNVGHFALDEAAEEIEALFRQISSGKDPLI